MPLSASVDAHGLESLLRRRLRGDVRFDNGSRALYASDASNYRQVPIGVVLPKGNDDVIAAVAACREFGAPLLCRGGGTSLAGQCCNVAVVLDFSRYMGNILEIDPARRIARVQPGVVLDNLRVAAEKHHLTFGPDPATHSRCTLGGMIGNNSCGVHSVMAGKTDDNIEEMQILLYDGTIMRISATSEDELQKATNAAGRVGQIYSELKAIRDQYGDLVRQRFPNIPRRVSGYNLNYLLPENGFNVARALVGSEGTCATVLEATCRLVESPQQRVLLVIACRDVYDAADRVPEVLAHKPIGLEGMDDTLVNYTRRRGLNTEGIALLPDGGGWLLIEFGADSQAAAEEQARGLMASMGRAGAVTFRLILDPGLARKVWEVRESALGAVARVPGGPPMWEGWEDSAVAPAKLGAYLRDLRKLIDSYGYRTCVYGHFGDGCTHNRINFDLQSTQGLKTFRNFLEEAADLVVSYGGSISGEHGDGQARAELYPRMFGPELMEAFRRFKHAWDPDWKMNPGKVILPNKMDHDLRLGVDYKPWQPATHFKFPQDDGSLASATLRCVGVGQCRQHEGGVMCPSFRVTGEEEHSTRGRAHLLWEMTKGDVITGGWRDRHVKSALDLCLSCKGCKSDCPVGVDVATYKAEFFSHYYQGRMRPLGHYAFSHVDLWMRVASKVPAIANFLTRTPVLSDLAKRIAGISPERRIPAVANESFREWFRKRGEPKHSAPPVVLWPDTFNNYFRPETAIAAVEVLEGAGFSVQLPPDALCCGRPLYDFGFLTRAKRLLREIMESLGPEIAAETPIVALEPGCASVFRDELLNLFPEDQTARRLSAQVQLFSEFIQSRGLPLPGMHRKALIHGHCHQKSVWKMRTDEALLQRLGVQFSAPAQGCCGMAGAFGFEKEKYDVSLAIGELELLPAIRNAPEDWLVIANGFSCREQIEQCTGRRTLHIAEVIARGLSSDLAQEARLRAEGPSAPLQLQR
jgi:FAD/FMN-containing dehydrogenase/Fe-S oxidoreductase